MPVISSAQDTFGQALLDRLHAKPPKPLILQRDDGWSTTAMPAGWFFQSPEEWFPWERAALSLAEGPALDLGAGAGRASLYLQQLGHAVTAVDNSPGAAEVCRQRGVEDVRLADFREVLPDDRRWRTVLLLCGNLGLGGTWGATRDLLRRLSTACAPGAVLLADTVDPTMTADEAILAYQRRQRAAGRYVGQIRLRLNHGDTVGPWWDQVNVRIGDVPELVANSGWRLEDHPVVGTEHYLKLRRD